MVFDHRLFTTPSADGTFAIEAVPPGTYQLSAWHERIGETTKTIQVTPANRPASSSRCQWWKVVGSGRPAAIRHPNADRDPCDGGVRAIGGAAGGHAERARPRARRRGRQARDRSAPPCRARGAARAGTAGAGRDARGKLHAQGRARYLSDRAEDDERRRTAGPGRHDRARAGQARRADSGRRARDPRPVRRRPGGLGATRGQVAGRCSSERGPRRLGCDVRDDRGWRVPHRLGSRHAAGDGARDASTCQRARRALRARAVRSVRGPDADRLGRSRHRRHAVGGADVGDDTRA